MLIEVFLADACGFTATVFVLRISLTDIGGVAGIFLIVNGVLEKCTIDFGVRSESSFECFQIGLVLVVIHHHSIRDTLMTTKQVFQNSIIIKFLGRQNEVKVFSANLRFNLGQLFFKVAVTEGIALFLVRLQIEDFGELNLGTNH